MVTAFDNEDPNIKDPKKEAEKAAKNSGVHPDIYPDVNKGTSVDGPHGPMTETHVDNNLGGKYPGGVNVFTMTQTANKYSRLEIGAYEIDTEKAREAVIKENEIKISGKVGFNVGQTKVNGESVLVLSDESRSTVAKQAQEVIKLYNDIPEPERAKAGVEFHGFASSTGGHAGNDKIAGQRAQALDNAFFEEVSKTNPELANILKKQSQMVNHGDRDAKGGENAADRTAEIKFVINKEVQQKAQKDDFNHSYTVVVSDNNLATSLTHGYAVMDITGKTGTSQAEITSNGFSPKDAKAGIGSIPLDLNSKQNTNFVLVAEKPEDLQKYSLALKGDLPPGAGLIRKANEDNTLSFIVTGNGPDRTIATFAVVTPEGDNKLKGIDKEFSAQHKTLGDQLNQARGLTPIGGPVRTLELDISGPAQTVKERQEYKNNTQAMEYVVPDKSKESENKVQPSKEFAKVNENIYKKNLEPEKVNYDPSVADLKLTAGRVEGSSQNPTKPQVIIADNVAELQNLQITLVGKANPGDKLEKTLNPDNTVTISAIGVNGQSREVKTFAVLTSAEEKNGAKAPKSESLSNAFFESINIPEKPEPGTKLVTADPKFIPQSSVSNTKVANLKNDMDNLEQSYSFHNQIKTIQPDVMNGKEAEKFLFGSQLGRVNTDLTVSGALKQNSYDVKASEQQMKVLADIDLKQGNHNGLIDGEKELAALKKNAAFKDMDDKDLAKLVRSFNSISHDPDSKSSPAYGNIASVDVKQK